MNYKTLMIKNWYLSLAVILGILLIIPVFVFGDSEDTEGASEEGLMSPELQEELFGADYTGTASCLMCHEDYKDGFLKTRHALSLGDKKAMPKDQGCEQCHGPGSQHVDMIGNESGDRGIFAYINDAAEGQFADNCLRCHAARINKADWLDARHTTEGIYCTGCHTVHDAEYDYQLKYATSLDLCYSCHTTVRPLFETSRSHHPLDDDTGCVICHDPHGEPDTMFYSESLELKCGKCHADRVGPFIYQHLSGTSDFGEGCLSCHMPHASANINMLKANGRALCLSCHTDLADHKGAATCWTSGCHSQIHGSNNNMLFIN